MTHSKNWRRGPRVKLYIRVSDTSGREESLISPDIQEREARRWCASQKDAQGVPLKVLGVVTDLDKTGRESSKRQIGDLIREVSQGDLDGIVVRSIDRWGRNVIDSSLNLRELLDAGGWIGSTSENLEDIDSPTGNLVLNFHLSMAQFTSDTISKGWKSVHSLRVESGRTSARTPRLGYLRAEDVNDGTALPEGVTVGLRQGKPVLVRDGEVIEYVPDPKTAPWIVKAFEWYLSGVSLRQVTARLDEAGMRSVRGNPFTYQTLRSALKGGFQAGLIVTRENGQETFTEGSHEPLVSRQTFEAFQARMGSNEAPRSKHGTTRLSRLVFCDSCGRRMQIYYSPARGNVKARRYWQCGRTRTAGPALTVCTSPATASHIAVEAVVWEWLQEHAEGQAALDTALARSRKALQAEKDVETIERDLRRQRKRLSLLADSVIDGLLTRETAQMKEAEIQDAIKRLVASMAASKTEATINALPDHTVFGALMAGWDMLDTSVVCEALGKVIGRIEVKRAPKRQGRPVIKVWGRWEEQPKVPLQAVG